MFLSRPLAALTLSAVTTLPVLAMPVSEFDIEVFGAFTDAPGSFVCSTGNATSCTPELTPDGTTWSWGTPDAGFSNISRLIVDNLSGVVPLNVPTPTRIFSYFNATLDDTPGFLSEFILSGEGGTITPPQPPLPFGPENTPVELIETDNEFTVSDCATPTPFNTPCDDFFSSVFQFQTTDFSFDGIDYRVEFFNEAYDCGGDDPLVPPTSLNDCSLVADGVLVAADGEITLFAGEENWTVLSQGVLITAQNVPTIPEPGSLALLATGLGFIGWRRRRSGS